MLETGNNNKTAIILFNLGGPDSIENVKPFLYNLFSDKWIIRIPFGIRHFFAFMISSLRAKSAAENYKLMGSKSPLLEETIKQKEALEIILKSRNFGNFKIFISMRYWHPRASEVICEVKDYNPDQVILLPLYPQFSSSTTLSSFEEFEALYKKAKINVPLKKIGCYFDQQDFINSHIKLIKQELKNFTDKENVRILFSAHSIPKKFVTQGDPYEWQINKTLQAILKDEEISKYDNLLCYQSKVGPIEWLSPSTEHEIEKAAKDKINLVIVPIAFISEHIETLVELDIEYKDIADKYGIKYIRIPALSIDENFIKGLADMVTKTSDGQKEVIAFNSSYCPENFTNCICRNKNG